MVRDAASRVFVPVFYNLTTNRTAPTYRRLLKFINDTADQQIQPGSSVVDFEQALIDSVQGQFTEARIVGCLFHWSKLCAVVSAGYECPKMKLDCRHVDCCYLQDKLIRMTLPGWNGRCVHFAINAAFTTLIVLFPPEVWNVHGMDLQVVSRTNNPLERFNRELNASITAPIQVCRLS
ncbi:hypothetical protein PHMEG_00038566 [Phytophthora megakarya]|uniref:Uncharacterized protein n=1 Tax=Phytophthora megakarya TaxID=4795 RepID=A0A225UHB3_9STRA|nr:hypothetical protein PHMEG_00038566 [Phytophthora megakarya]